MHNYKVVDLSPVLFREYDLRGIVGDIIDENVSYTIGLNFGSYVQDMGNKTVLVGHDNRLSSDSVTEALICGLKESGVDVVYLGLCTTPMLYYARYKLNLYAAIMVTASHNPKEYNGFKISFTDIGNAYGPLIQEFYQFTLKKKYHKGNGKLTNYDIREEYLNEFINSVDLKRKDLKVVVDCGNGTGSIIIKDILDRLGIEYYLLYCESDGSFPHHPSDPSVEAYMEDLKKKVVELGYDLGIGIDGDADRVAVVSEKGQYVCADLYLLFMARYLKPILNGNRILYDVKCSRSLIDGLNEIGVGGYMNRTGNSYQNMKMKEGDFTFGGEYSGHIWFRDKWVGFDDGIYAGARFIEMLANTNQKVSDLLASVIPYYSEFIEVRAGETGKRKVVEKIKEYSHSKGYTSEEVDGIRIEFERGWALVRFSNTSPNLTIRYEGKTVKDMNAIKKEIGTLVDKYIKEYQD